MSHTVPPPGGFLLEYPRHEEARFFSGCDGFPLKGLFIGATDPFPAYEVRRPASGAYYLLEYLLAGEGTVLLDGEERRIKEGDVLFFEKDSPQCYASVREHPMKKLWISFPGGYTEAMIRSFRLRTGIYPAKELEEEFRRIFALSRSGASFDEICYPIADALHRMITALSRIAGKSDVTEEVVLKNRLSAWVYKKATLPEMAQELQMSPATLLRTFRKRCGETPYHYLLSEKLRAARHLLVTTGMSVKEISYLLCFTDEHYFSHYFTESVGISPTLFREQNRVGGIPSQKKQGDNDADHIG